MRWFFHQFIENEFVKWYSSLTWVARMRCMRKEDTQTRKETISCFTGERSHFGNKSLTGVTTASTQTNQQTTVRPQKESYSNPKGVTSVSSQQNQHQEETNAPELRRRHQSSCLSIGDEDQTWTCEVRTENSIKPIQSCSEDSARLVLYLTQPRCQC